MADGKFIDPSTTSGKQVATASSGPDNGFLNCAAAKYAGCRRHATTRAAIDNLVGMLPANLSDAEAAGALTCVIIGHGNEGLFTTGVGQGSQYDKDKWVLTWNRTAWEPEFTRLKAKPFAILTLLTCTTGAGEDGAELLFRIATAVGKPTQARTGLTYCNGGITYEPGSTWQVAQPGVKPTPIQSPSHHFIGADAMLLVLDSGRGPENVPAEGVRRITIAVPPSFARGVGEFVLEGAEAQALAAEILFRGEPFQANLVGGLVTAEITAELTLRGQTRRERFLVWNDTLIQSDATGFAHYIDKAQFRSLPRRL